MRSTIFTGLGFFLLVLAFIYIYDADRFDTAPLGTHNIGLLQQQMVRLQMGIGFMLLAGCSSDLGSL